MKYRVAFQPRARQQLEDQYEFIAEQNLRAAVNWFNRSVAALQTLSHLPERCAVVPQSELVGREIRQFLFGKRAGIRRAYFTIDGDTVRILAIRHSAQSEPALDELLDD